MHGTGNPRVSDNVYLLSTDHTLIRPRPSQQTAHFKSIGRVNNLDQHIGTAWLFPGRNDRAVTAAHVVSSHYALATGLPKQTSVLSIDFGVLPGSGPVAKVTHLLSCGECCLDGVLPTDVAIVQLEWEAKKLPIYEVIPIVATTAHSDVYVLGYPGMYGNPADMQAFCSVSGVKVITYGRMQPSKLADLVQHTCPTLPGHSGSPVFTVGTDMLLGMHVGMNSERENLFIPWNTIQRYALQHNILKGHDHTQLVCTVTDREITSSFDAFSTALCWVSSPDATDTLGFLVGPTCVFVTAEYLKPPYVKFDGCKQQAMKVTNIPQVGSFLTIKNAESRTPLKLFGSPCLPIVPVIPNYVRMTFLTEKFSVSSVVVTVHSGLVVIPDYLRGANLRGAVLATQVGATVGFLMPNCKAMDIATILNETYRHSPETISSALAWGGPIRNTLPHTMTLILGDAIRSEIDLASPLFAAMMSSPRIQGVIWVGNRIYAPHAWKNSFVTDVPFWEDRYPYFRVLDHAVADTLPLSRHYIIVGVDNFAALNSLFRYAGQSINTLSITYACNAKSLPCIEMVQGCRYLCASYTALLEEVSDWKYPQFRELFRTHLSRLSEWSSIERWLPKNYQADVVFALAADNTNPDDARIARWLLGAKPSLHTSDEPLIPACGSKNVLRIEAAAFFEKVQLHSKENDFPSYYGELFSARLSLRDLLLMRDGGDLPDHLQLAVVKFGLQKLAHLESQYALCKPEDSMDVVGVLQDFRRHQAAFLWIAEFCVESYQKHKTLLPHFLKAIDRLWQIEIPHSTQVKVARAIAQLEILDTLCVKDQQHYHMKVTSLLHTPDEAKKFFSKLTEASISPKFALFRAKLLGKDLHFYKQFLTQEAVKEGTDLPFLIAVLAGIARIALDNKDEKTAHLFLILSRSVACKLHPSHPDVLALSLLKAELILRSTEPQGAIIKLRDVLLHLGQCGHLALQTNDAKKAALLLSGLQVSPNLKACLRRYIALFPWTAPHGGIEALMKNLITSAKTILPSIVAHIPADVWPELFSLVLQHKPEEAICFVLGLCEKFSQMMLAVQTKFDADLVKATQQLAEALKQESV